MLAWYVSGDRKLFPFVPTQISIHGFTLSKTTRKNAMKKVDFHQRATCTNTFPAIRRLQTTTEDKIYAPCKTAMYNIVSNFPRKRSRQAICTHPENEVEEEQQIFDQDHSTRCHLVFFSPFASETNENLNSRLSMQMIKVSQYVNFTCTHFSIARHSRPISLAVCKSRETDRLQSA